MSGHGGAVRPVRPSTTPDALADFETFPFTALGTTRRVFRKGEGPGVLVMHEIPGITPEVADFARLLADAGYTVFLPHLFGTPGKPYSAWGSVVEITRACISREFAVLASGRSSPVVQWLRVLLRQLHAECGGPGVGALGMCLTGNFALAMMVEPALLAPVLSQPSLPFSLTPGLARGLHLSDEELAAAKARAPVCPVLGLRMSGDLLVFGARFARLKEELGDGFIDGTVELGDRPSVAPIPHSVLTTELVTDDPDHPTRAALQAVLDHFDRQLRPG